MPKLRMRHESLERLLRVPAITSSHTQISTVRSTQLLLAALGGAERLDQLKSLYDKARPRRRRHGHGILTIDEVFRENARKEGYSDDGVALFIDQLD